MRRSKRVQFVVGAIQIGYCMDRAPFAVVKKIFLICTHPGKGIFADNNDAAARNLPFFTHTYIKYIVVAAGAIRTHLRWCEKPMCCIATNTRHAWYLHPRTPVFRWHRLKYVSSKFSRTTI